MINKIVHKKLNNNYTQTNDPPPQITYKIEQLDFSEGSIGSVGSIGSIGGFGAIILQRSGCLIL
jgi:hypothetical protein